MRRSFTVPLVLTSVLCFVAPCLAQEAMLPRPEHVVIVIEENKGYGDVIGLGRAPYLDSLAKSGALLTNYHGLHHPSQPNYLELFSGAEQGVCNDDKPGALIHAPNLAMSLLSADKGFVGFAENLPSNLATWTQGDYARRHCPWLSFTEVPAEMSADFLKFPQTEAGFANLPAVAIVIPNLVDDMHSSSPSGGFLNTLKNLTHNVPAEVSNGDQWLADHLDAYAKWAMTHNSLLVVTWDEDSSHYLYPHSCEHGINTTAPKNQIPTILVGEPVAPGSTTATTYTHYNLLRTIEDMFSLPPLGGSAGAQPITGIWK